MRYSKHCLILLVTMGFGACHREVTQPAPPPPFYTKTSIRELMDAEVDPAADAVWESVAYIDGEEKRPHTPEEWQAVRRSAVTLVEATNLLVMDGRRIAPVGAHYVDEVDPEVLQARLDANRASFVGMAQALRVAALKTLDAIDAQDTNRIFELGSDLDAVCEACHVAYWYPPDLQPKP